MSLFDKTEGYLGIDIGAGGIKLVELHKTKDRPQLWTYGFINQTMNIHLKQKDKSAEELIAESKGKDQLKKKPDSPEEKMNNSDPRIDKYAKLLKQLVKQAKVVSRHATASLPVSRVFHSVLTLPYVEEQKREPIVKAEIEKMLSRPVDQMQIVFQEIPYGENNLAKSSEQDKQAARENKEQKKSKYIRLLVTAAPKDLVSFYSAIFQKAGLELEELETEAFALVRSLVGYDNSTMMLVDIGAERTNFFIVDGGLPMTHSSIQAGGKSVDKKLSEILGIDIQKAGQVKKDIASYVDGKIDASQFEFVVEPIIKEIQYGFDLYLKQSGNEAKKPEKIVLTGGTSMFAGILEPIRNAFDMKVFVGDPWARVVYQQGLKPVLDEIGPRMSVAIGLAMRNIVSTQTT